MSVEIGFVRRGVSYVAPSYTGSEGVEWHRIGLQAHHASPEAHACPLGLNLHASYKYLTKFKKRMIDIYDGWTVLAVLQ